MVGKKVSHYRILEKLGEGGMGVVFKAEDTKLERTVALKFLPPDALSSEDDKARFIQEARAAAALDHPNICTIYEINEADDQTYISMAYVDGLTLRDKIDKGPQSVEATLDISMRIAEGLQAAHEKGIIHRDIKSANIMLNQSGHTKIMDFGLAKLLGTGQEQGEHSTMGTVAYMSPEQTRADPVDQRTDIWSLGVVMYEMITGLRPFRGDYEQSVIYAIVNEDPEPITALRTGVPLEFERIVMKALAKGEKQRYQRMEDLIVDLRRLKAELDSKELLSRSGIRPAHARRGVRNIAVPTVILAFFGLVLLGSYLRSGHREAEGAQIPIAVADFINETSDPELDGLSGMLITSLEQSRRLSVLTRSSMFDILERMGHEDVTRIDEAVGREICAHAGVDILIIASIRKFDELYSIDLKAFERGRDDHLFAAKEEGTGRASIPSMIDKLAEKTRKSLKEKSTEISKTSEKVADVTTPNLEAYQQYFLGDQSIDHLKFGEAQDAFQEAIVLDSTFALAHYRLAYANWWGGENEEIQRAQLEKAVSLIHRLPEKYRYLLRAQVAVNTEGYDAGVEVLKEMEAIYPDDKEMIYNIGDFSFHAKQYDQAEAYLGRVLEMDPDFERALNHLAMTYTEMGEKEKALAVGIRYAELAKTDYAYRTLSNAFLANGDLDAALETAEMAGTVLPGHPMVRHQIAMVRCMKDEFALAKSILDSLVVETQEYKVRAMGYSSLLGANLYMGKYREALGNADDRIKLALETGDSAQAVFQYQLKGLIYSWGWGDLARADFEFEKARALQEQLGSDGFGYEKSLEDYWANVAMYDVLIGREEIAEEIAANHLKGGSEQEAKIRFFVRWKRGDFEGAHAIADSLLETAKADQRTIMLYYLAQSQMEHGLYGEAAHSLRTLQTDTHYSGPRPFFYPQSYYLLAQSAEQEGNIGTAIESYSKFLEYWRDADDDLPLLRKAKLRLAELERTATQ